MIRDGYNEEADRLRHAKTEGKTWLAELEARERESTGIKNLKVKYNKVFGYYFEVTNSFKDLVPEYFIRKQTLTNAERFTTDELKQLEDVIMGAEEKLVSLEYDLFCQVRDSIAAQVVRIQKTAKAIEYVKDGNKGEIALTENDLVFYTNGSNVENSTYGSQTTATGMDCEIHEGGTFDLWRKIAAQDPAFGHPDKFCTDPEDSNWVSATVNTLDEKILPYIQRICKRDPLSGKVVTGGIVTVKDSSWLLSWTINRQPQ